VGERPLPAPAEAHIRRIEIPYGRFERRIALPPGAFEIREHRMVDGCLLLTLLKLG
jgi:HSP20 family molecular chaperone IbpA